MFVLENYTLKTEKNIYFKRKILFKKFIQSKKLHIQKRKIRNSQDESDTLNKFINLMRIIIPSKKLFTQNIGNFKEKNYTV